MVVIGADVHKRTHTFVAVDDVGRELGSKKTVPATTPGHTAAVRWAREKKFGSDVVWGASRTAAICPHAWNVICSRPDRRWCG